MTNPKPIGGTFACYRCGQRFDNQHVRRRRVGTGRTFTGQSWRMHSNIVSLCPRCSRRETRKTILRTLLYIAILIAVAAVILQSNIVNVTVR